MIDKEQKARELREQYELERNEYQLGFQQEGETFPPFDRWVGDNDE